MASLFRFTVPSLGAAAVSLAFALMVSAGPAFAGGDGDGDDTLAGISPETAQCVSWADAAREQLAAAVGRMAPVAALLMTDDEPARLERVNIVRAAIEGLHSDCYIRDPDHTRRRLIALIDVIDNLDKAD